MNKNALNIRKIISRIREEETSSKARKGSFKIEGTFEQAMEKILRAKPATKKPAKKREQKHNI